MNAERLFLIAKAVKQDLAQTNIGGHLQQLIAALQGQINQPQAAQFQQQVSQIKSSIMQSLDKAPSNEFSPSWRQVIAEIGANGLLGKELQYQIESVFNRNQITPSLALTDIQGLHGRISQLQAVIDQLISSFSALKIGEDHIESGMAEIGILIPRAFVGAKLGRFADELAELDNILKTFSEVATGRTADWDIRAISSSDLTVYITAGLKVAALMAVTLERIIAAYKNLLDIRKLRSDLSNKGVPENALSDIEKYARSLMGNAIDDMVKGLVEEFYEHEDKDRKNELVTALRYASKRLAARIDRGFNIEVRAEQPKDKGAPGSQKNTGEGAASQEYCARISSATKALEFMKLEGDPILQLPGPGGDGTQPQVGEKLRN
jgi:hypothetical protein